LPAPVSAECRVQEFVDSLMSEGRFALLLRPQIAANLSPNLLALARQRLERQMTLVPEGEVLLEPHLAAGEPDNEAEAIAAQGTVAHVAAAFLDRYTVTNRQFQVFVTAGGYDQMAIWDPTIWPAVLDFVDGTGHPGPRYWQHGRFPPGKADHPVVGVCWYEAAAYARWIGKRLPTDAEWLKAGCWPVQLSPESRLQRKFPWGNAMDRSRANLWGSGPGDTVAVDDYATGVSVGGVSQLIGNVWEWTAADFELPAAPVSGLGGTGAFDDGMASDYSAAVARMPLKALRGAAFDTYFDHHAACQAASGDSPLARKYNIGFRLALGICDLVPPPESEADVPPEAEAAAPTETALQPA
jgi:iron(II)-dependent oxidoreductase